MEKEAVLPKNVRQIGDIQGNRRIYMEDYVMTYIHRKEQQEERGFLGVFLGERQETEEGTLVFIRGLVEVPDEDAAEQSSRDLKKRKKIRERKADANRDREETEESQEGTAAEKSGGVHMQETGRSGKPQDTHAAGTDAKSNGKNAGGTARENSAAEEETKKIRLDMEEFPDQDGEPEEPGEKRTVLEECREFFGPSEIQGCCVIGEYPVKRMEYLADEVPQSRRFLYHLQEQEETLYWAEAEKYEQIPGYFVFYEQNKEMQEYMAEMFEEEGSEQASVPDRAIKNFRAKIRKKDQVKLNGMLKLASSFFVAAVLLVGAVIVNRMEERRSGDIMIEVPENEAQSQLPSGSAVVMRSGTETDSAENPVLSGAEGTVMVNAGAGAVQPAAGETGTENAGVENFSDPGAGAVQPVNGGSDEGGTAADFSGAGTDQLSENGEGAVQTAAAGNDAEGTVQPTTDGSTVDFSGAGTDPAGGTDQPSGNRDGAVQTAAAGNDAGADQANGAVRPVNGGSDADGSTADFSGEGTEQANEAVQTAAAGNDAEGIGQTTTDGNGAGESAVETSDEGTDPEGENQPSGAADSSAVSAAALIQNGIGGTGVQPAQNGAEGTVDGTPAQAGINTKNSMESEAAAVAGLSQPNENGTTGADGAGTSVTDPEEDKEASVEASARQTRASYIIREGDTLADICQTYYGGLDKLDLICEANRIEDANMIMPGQKIVLP